MKIPAVTPGSPSKIVRVSSGSVRKIANPDGPPGRGRGRDNRGDIGVDEGHVASAVGLDDRVDLRLDERVGRE